MLVKFGFPHCLRHWKLSTKSKMEVAMNRTTLVKHRPSAFGDMQLLYAVGHTTAIKGTPKLTPVNKAQMLKCVGHDYEYAAMIYEIKLCYHQLLVSASLLACDVSIFSRIVRSCMRPPLIWRLPTRTFLLVIN